MDSEKVLEMLEAMAGQVSTLAEKMEKLEKKGKKPKKKDKEGYEALMEKIESLASANKDDTAQYLLRQEIEAAKSLDGWDEYYESAEDLFGKKVKEQIESKPVIEQVKMIKGLRSTYEKTLMSQEKGGGYVSKKTQEAIDKGEEIRKELNNLYQMPLDNKIKNPSRFNEKANELILEAVARAQNA